MEYKYTTDWQYYVRHTWPMILEKYKGGKNINFLEIGCWEGMTTNWMFDNILTDKTSKATVVDVFLGSPEETWMKILDLNTIRERFEFNTSKHGDKITILEGYSTEVLKNVDLKPTYDICYIDGTHTAYGTLEDAVLVHPLIKLDGLIIFDDYKWKDSNRPSATQSPALGIECFSAVYKDFYQLVYSDYQVVLKKIKI